MKFRTSRIPYSSIIKVLWLCRAPTHCYRVDVTGSQVSRSRRHQNHLWEEVCWQLLLSPVILFLNVVAGLGAVLWTLGVSAMIVASIFRTINVDSHKTKRRWYTAEKALAVDRTRAGFHRPIEGWLKQTLQRVADYRQCDFLFLFVFSLLNSRLDLVLIWQTTK